MFRPGEQESLATGLPANITSAPYDAVGFATDRFYYGRAGSTLTWWDSATGQVAGTLDRLSADVGKFAIAPDGSTVALVRTEGVSQDSRAKVELWDARAGQRRGLAGEQPPFLSLNTVSFSPDGRLLLVAGPTYVNEGGSNRVVRAWDVATGELYQPLSDESPADPQRFPAHFGRHTDLSFTPDGRRVVVASEEGLTVWNTDDGSRAAEISSGDAPVSATAMAFSANGNLALLPDAYSVTARVWDLAEGAVKLQLRGHSGRVDLVDMSADGSVLMTASNQDGTLRVWDGETGEQLSILPFPGGRAESLGGWPLRADCPVSNRQRIDLSTTVLRASEGCRAAQQRPRDPPAHVRGTAGLFTRDLGLPGGDAIAGGQLKPSTCEKQHHD